MTFVLYYAPNTCALVPYVTLTECGADFEVRPVNFRKHEQMSPEFLKINPKHKVPLLIADGKSISENPAIALYLSRAFPQARLMPENPWQEVQAVSIHSWCASGIHPHLSRINSPSKFCDAPGAEEAVVRLAMKELHDQFAIANAMLAGRDFFFDHLTTADLHMFWCLRRASQLGVDIGRFGDCKTFFDRILQLPSVQKLYDYEKKVLADFAKAA